MTAITIDFSTGRWATITTTTGRTTVVEDAYDPDLTGPDTGYLGLMCAELRYLRSELRAVRSELAEYGDDDGSVGDAIAELRAEIAEVKARIDAA